MSIRVCIVGCGAIADNHAEELLKLPDVAIVGACDREQLVAEQLAIRFGIPAFYDDFSRMLREQAPDAVHVATPPGSHLALALEALEAGCHVLVEKPITMSAEDARTLIDRADALDRRLTVGHIYEFDPPSLRLRALVESGKLGDIVHVDSHFGYNLLGNFGRAITGSASHWVHAMPGNIWQNNVSHALAKVVPYLGQTTPTTQTTAIQGLAGQFSDVRDRLYTEVRTLIKGTRVTANVTFTAGARPVAHFVRVYGSHNTVHVDLVGRTVSAETSPRLPSALGRVFPAFSRSWQFQREGWRNAVAFARSRFHFMAGMQELFRRFYHSIQTGGAPPVPYDEILASARIVDDVLDAIGARDRGPGR